MNSPRRYLCHWKIQFYDWGNPQLGTPVGYPGLPGSVRKWVCYGHISGHQLHRSRNSVLMHSELTGLLRAELQEPHSWGTEHKIKCEDFPRIRQRLSGPQTKLVIKKAHSHEEDGIDRREVERFEENISHESGKADKISLLDHSTFYQLNWRNTDHLWILIPLLISADLIPLGDMLPQMY